MTFTILREPTAIDLAARFLADDPDGLALAFSTVDALADKPLPAGAFSMGRFGMSPNPRARTGLSTRP